MLFVLVSEVKHKDSWCIDEIVFCALTKICVKGFIDMKKLKARQVS